MLCVLLASCVCGATIAAAQSKAAAGSAKSARLYFLRQYGLMGGIAADTRILVNDQAVGIVEPGSYLTIDRPPGRYKLHLETKIQILPNSFETEVTVAAGQTYYFEIGVATSPTGAGWGSALLMGNVGKRMDGRGSFGGNSYQFNSLDTATGAAEVRKLKPMKR
jgi:hypothetical protein